MATPGPWGIPLGETETDAAATAEGGDGGTQPPSLTAPQQQQQAAAAAASSTAASEAASDTIGGLASRPASMPGNPAAGAATAAAAAIQGAAALTAEAGQALAAAAQVRRRQQRAEDLRAAVLTRSVARTPAQADMVLEFLAGSYGLMRNLQPSVLRLLGQAMEGLALEPGEVLYSIGDPSSSGSFYVVVTGEVGLWEPAGEGEAATANAEGGSAAGTLAHAPRGAEKGASAAASGSGGSSGGGGAAGERTGSSKAGETGPPAMVEVLRTGPRESFGDDDLAPGGTRQQTARAAGSSAAGGGTSADDGRGDAVMTSAGPAVAAVGASGPAGGRGRSPTKGRSAAAGKAAAGLAAAGVGMGGGQVVLLALPADEYFRVLQGRMGRMQEEKVDFLETLPALQSLSRSYLRDLAHCFHQTEFEPREVVVRQGDVADSMFIIRHGQVCVLIDPAFTAAAAAAGDGGRVEGLIPEQDLKRLVQVVILGPGSLIGDMSVTVGAMRSATVVALTDLVTYKVQLSEWRRRMPREVLENMRKVASAKAAMNEQHAERRRAQGTQRQGGHVMLGERAMPQAVLQGRTLRALADPRKNEAPIEVLRAALAALPGAGLAGAREAALSEAFLQSLRMSGPGAVAPRELLGGHVEGGSTMATTTPPRASGFWGAFPLPVPRGPQLPGVRPPDDPRAAGGGGIPSPNTLAGQIGRPAPLSAAMVTAGKDAGAGGSGLSSNTGSRTDSGRQSPAGGPALADGLEEVAQRLRQQRLTPRMAAAAAAEAAPRRSASLPTEGTAKAAAAAAVAGLGAVSPQAAAAGGISPRAGGGFAGGLRHSAASPTAGKRSGGPLAVGAAVLPSLTAQGLMVVTSVAGRSAACIRAASPIASSAAAAAASVAAAAESAAAAAAAGAAAVAATDPSGHAARAGVLSPTGLPTGTPSDLTVGEVAGGKHGGGGGSPPVAAGKGLAPSVPGFTGPLLQSTGGLIAAAAAAGAAAAQQQQQHQPSPKVGALSGTAAEALAPGELPGGVQAVVLRPSNKGAEPQLLFHGAESTIAAAAAGTAARPDEGGEAQEDVQQ